MYSFSLTIYCWKKKKKHQRAEMHLLAITSAQSKDLVLCISRFPAHAQEVVFNCC